MQVHEAVPLATGSAISGFLVDGGISGAYVTPL